MSQQYLFQGLPNNYNLLKDNIQNRIIKDLYSFFEFKYITFDIIINYTNAKKLILSYLNDFKLIIYQITDAKQIENQKEPYKNIIICTEKQCLIIESIKASLFLDIIKQVNSSFINISDETSTRVQMEINEEIKSFINKFDDQVKNNEFVNYTIRPIISYMIRRHFYPSNFFKDPSFFNYTMQSNQQNENKINNFEPNDFIDLRCIDSRESKIFKLVIHVKSFYIFVKKKVHFADYSQISKEINFCKNYSHRCMNKCYGTYQENETTFCFIYEFMSNGNLYSFIENHQEEIDFFYSFMTMNRLLQAINYLHSNQSIHRDINPMNILINHDNIPFLSDFETIRSIEGHEMTMTIGSSYASPEQLGKSEFKISYSSDIYSFALVIFFLFEKKDMIYSENDDVPQMINTPNLIQNIIKKCIMLNPNDRMKISEINDKIKELIYSQFYFEPSFLIERLNLIKKENLDLFFIENIKIVSNENRDLILFFESFIEQNDVGSVLKEIGKDYAEGNTLKVDYYKSKLILDESIKLGNSDALNYLGILYLNGFGVSQDFTKAKELFQISIDRNNPFAFMHMGKLYLKGLAVDRDIKKAIMFFEKSAEMNNSGAMNHLGLLYLKGNGVQRDYGKAINYFETSAKLKNSNALNFLGNIYLNGYGVKQDLIKSREYFESALLKGNHNAYIHIGNFYLKGLGVNKDYQKAKEYFELSAQRNSSDALIGLGFLYLIGLGVDKDYQKAKEYFELSAKLNNSFAEIYIGNLYFYGLGVKRDCDKAKEYYKSSIKKGNTKAYNKLGRVYCDSYGDTEDTELAMNYFNLSYQNGNPEALIYIGDLFLKAKNINVDKAIEYYEKAAKELYNNDAYIRLGKLYFEGIFVKTNFQQALSYFKNAAVKNDPDAFYYLGRIYYEGLGEKCDFIKAKQYFELSIHYDGIKAYYYLGLIYENGEGVEIDKNKAIEYYKKCAENHDEIFIIFNSDYWNEKIQTNENVYLANNNLSLLYIIDFNDIKSAEKYLKNAAFSELSYAQNNLGLFYQLFLKEIHKAEDMFEKASKNHFSIAEFFIGHNKEIENKENESIKHYLNAIQYENTPIKSWINDFIVDKRLDISKIFTTFMSSIKIAHYHCKNKQFKDAKKFIINSIFKPAFKLLFENNNDSFSFKFEIVRNHDNSIKTNYKEFILSFPLFNIQTKMKNENRSDFGWKSIENQEIKTVVIQLEIVIHPINNNNRTNSLTASNENSFSFISDEIKNIFDYNNSNHEFTSFKNHSNCDNYEIQFESNSNKLKRILKYPKSLSNFIDLNEIDNELIDLNNQMEKIINEPPFSILFGRIPCSKSNSIQAKNIDSNFYEGLK